MTDRKAVYCDLDGTLCNCEHRRHHLETNDWGSFFREMCNDTIYSHTEAVLRALHAAGYAIIIGSARPEDSNYRDMTIEWLKRHKIPYSGVYMRKAGDYRKDNIVKIELLEEMLNDGWDIHFALDDRESVVQAFRDYGLPVLQVNDGDFDTNKISKYVKQAQGQELLHIMVGPSGAGKSTYISKHYKESDVVSTDQIRVELFGSFDCAEAHTPENLARTWSYAHALIKTRLDHGIFTVLDATSIKKKDRTSVLELLPKGIQAAYIVIDREFDQKLKTRGWRPERLIEKHHNTFKSNLKDILKGDEHPYVWVIDAREHKV